MTPQKQYQIKTSGLDGAAVTVTPTIINGGSYVKVLYTITNNGGTAITEGKLAVHSDIQIGDNDDAAIEIIQDGDGNAIGFRMIDDHTENKNRLHISRRTAQPVFLQARAALSMPIPVRWLGNT